MKKNLLRAAVLCLTLSGTLCMSANAALTDTKTTDAALVGAKTVTAPLISTRTALTAEKFSDIDSESPYLESIRYCVKNGLLKGVSDTAFAPELAVTRAMLATVLWRMEGEPFVNYAMSFTDVKPDQWYTEAIRWTEADGIAAGCSDGQFGPDASVTRGQMAEWLYRYAEFKGYDLGVNENAELPGENDDADESMIWAVERGMITASDDEITSASSVTRAEMADMLQRFCVLYTDKPAVGVVGGWRISDDMAEAELPEGAAEAFEKAMDGFTGVGYTPVAYLGSQVVAGVNYAYLCKAVTVTAQPETRLAVVIVYRDLQGNAVVSSIKNVDLTECTKEADTEFRPGNYAGGWHLNTEAGVLPEGADEAFENALNGLVGVGYTPLTCMGSQVVAGRNYAVLCTAKTVSASPASALAVVVVNAPVSGDAKILRICGFSFN